MISVGPIGITNSSALSHPHQHRRHLLMPHVKRVQQCCRCTCHRTKRPTTTTTTTTYPPNDDDVDFDKDELTKLRAKEQRRLARQRASRARYRARHPDRVATSKQRYRAKRRRKTNPVSFDDYDDDDDDDDVCGVYDELAELHAKEAQRSAQSRAASARYRARHPDRVSGYRKRYYETHAEQLRAYQRQRRQSEAGQRWKEQFRARKREAAALLARQRGSMERQRTAEKRQALGPLTLTVTLEDFMQDFDDSLASTPKDSMDQPCAITIRDMDSGDYAVCNESSLSSCDMWDDGRGFLDNLLEELSALPSPSSSSDDSLCDLSSDDSLYGLIRDMSVDEWTSQDSCFDLDDFVT